MQPERPASSTATGLSPPTLWLSVMAPKTLMPGHGLGDDLRALAGLDVMRLEDEALHAVGEELLRAVDVVDAPRDHVGPDVDLQVVGAFQRLPGTI